jgi:NAD(P)-dependent dehydrogenase (short-subunit alcohol dehydrogenase family)
VTGRLDAIIDTSPTSGKDATYGAQPIPRIGRPVEVANLMVFLASDESSCCTGAEYLVDGGFLAGPPIAGMEA